jgi:hypothetical protein
LTLARPTRSALRRIQRRIERYYALERAPDVTRFASAGGEGEREVLFVRDDGNDVEVALRVPGEEPRAGANDVWLQLVEGVSHFVYLAERVRRELPATKLELELQAEVDKFVFLALDSEATSRSPRRGMRDPDARTLHSRIFDHATFLDPPGTEAGERYRFANRLAARLGARLVGRGDGEVRALLRRFYRAGQAEKIALAQAA